MELLGFIISFLILFLLARDEKKVNPREKPLDKKPIPKKQPTPTPKAETLETDPLKIKGDLYEKFIGQSFEQKGELVIYNGFIYGYADKGVDVISICVKRKTINLIQCKHWSYKKMFIENIEEIYQKLSYFGVEEITNDSRAIKKYLQKKRNLAEIEEILTKDKAKFSVRKTLYMSSDKVIDLDIGSQLKLIKKNIFKYKDMKIVIIEI